MAAIIVLTDRGLERALFLAEFLPGEVEIYAHEHCHKQIPANGCMPTQPASEQKPTHGFRSMEARRFRRLRELLPELWLSHRLLILIMATGIVVREMGSLLQGKERDPAVLVGDEAGRFLIPLLSGHLGGANAWANYLAARAGSTAVITTATDVQGFTAPDEYARRFDWKVEPLEHLPGVNRKLLDYGHLGYFSEQELPAAHPLCRDPHYQEAAPFQADIIISAFPTFPSAALYLIPRILSIGVGCRRGVSSDAVLEAIAAAMTQIGASYSALKGIYSIDLKAGEQGLIEAAARLGIPFITFKASEIQTKNEETGITPSEFVQEKIGVDGVCEAASLLGTENGSLILPKTKMKGITVAISRERSWLSVSDPVIPNI
ncbi:MAG: cobalamin biosynthesis protein [Desulfitobacteriaceae bacterium]|nr:cobalamin biosynthesis protein [Desulfitobacteriaceae bacterium]MDI6879918.1 cobalamin biosynthesis protein [Desulfitobacteriaceae bacterium]MDI6915440.1 cobalamin biosynthesis protein [Desulfitobacteriaceae bacterium]